MLEFCTLSLLRTQYDSHCSLVLLVRVTGHCTSNEESLTVVSGELEMRYGKQIMVGRMQMISAVTLLTCWCGCVFLECAQILDLDPYFFSDFVSVG